MYDNVIQINLGNFVYNNFFKIFFKDLEQYIWIKMYYKFYGDIVDIN